MGSIAFHKAHIKKQLKEKLAAELLRKDLAKGKREKSKIAKRVTAVRRELKNFL